MNALPSTESTVSMTNANAGIISRYSKSARAGSNPPELALENVHRLLQLSAARCDYR